ncbi:ferritin-like domain-containing protein [Galbibacter pacificus]|uniref:Ferritin-like domain-containing protein n=1 Tax=Galbibacter pacificus TaxID=2996052 RepID=A0ABT6FVT4_9FLAO|nr:ferritin-like domain-containing protein [Galbibacter pacificus]MDG3583696.1 ferritin-like domain-containing protein [Galbibacter pacificus]MDG3587386.1 ferritin-like domain-containing protein [Galbibacter pacificus]
MKKKIIKVHQPKGFNNRRQFLKLGGLAVAGSGLLWACSSDDDQGMMPPPDSEVFDLGEGDLGVLNYAYALEQLEADFYTKVVNSFYGSISDEEKQVLTDLYYHEVNHRDFFKTAITAAVEGNTELVLPTLEFDYGDLDFGNRDQVLGTAKVLEDTGVAAYNGAGKLISNPDYLLIAGKIVSVEARHASAIRTLINPGSADFAGDDAVTVDTGLDAAMDPSDILAAVAATGFIKTEFTANNLP